MKKIMVILLVFILSQPVFAQNASEWAFSSIYSAESAGIITDVNDFDDYTRPVSREEICTLAVKTYEAVIGEPCQVSAADNPFTDTDSLYAVAAEELGIIGGRKPFLFEGGESITRQESAKLFVCLAELLGLKPSGDAQKFSDIHSVASWAKDYVEKASAYGYLTSDYKGEFLPEHELTVEQAIAVLMRMYRNALPNAELEYSGSGFTAEQSIEKKLLKTGLFEYNGFYKKNDPSLVFTEGEIKTKEQADSQMKKITVKIWELKDGQKVSGEMELTVHKNIADKTVAVFEDIYNGSEKFPIDKYGTYGYSFRSTAGGNRLSEHATGTAIDVNPDQNYCIYSNGSVVGSLYEPGKNPYSIKKFGDCWTAFVSHGFTWGGDAWESPQDYMHFSYLGK